MSRDDIFNMAAAQLLRDYLAGGPAVGLLVAAKSPALSQDCAEMLLSLQLGFLDVAVLNNPAVTMLDERLAQESEERMMRGLERVTLRLANEQSRSAVSGDMGAYEEAMTASSNDRGEKRELEAALARVQELRRVRADQVEVRRMSGRYPTR